MKSIRILAREAAKVYNEKRSPEAVLDIVNVDDGSSLITVRIKGPFCRTCGVEDWIIDYQYELKEKGVEAKITNYHIDYENEEAIAQFKVIKKQ